MEALKTLAVTACLITGKENAAIAIISLCGAGASEIINRNFTPATARKFRPGEVRYGAWHGSASKGDNAVPSESVVVAFLDATDQRETGAAPLLGTAKTVDADATENWEIHCHGGAAAIGRILDDVVAAGASVVHSDDLLTRAGISKLRQESLNAIGRTTTIRTAAVVLDQVRGAMEDFVSDALVRLETNAVDAINFIHRQADAIRSFDEFGKHLTKPWNVVLAGSPNVGKSSLINALVGYQRSITLDRPGTTRDVLHADAVIDGWPILLSDTAGIRQNPAESIEQQGIYRALDALRIADLVLWVEVASDDIRTETPPELEQSRRRLRVINKVDLASQIPTVPTNQTVLTSATLGIGIDTLRQAIVTTLIPTLPPAGFPVPIAERQVRILNDILEAENATSMRSLLKQLLGH